MIDVENRKCGNSWFKRLRTAVITFTGILHFALFVLRRKSSCVFMFHPPFSIEPADAGFDGLPALDDGVECKKIEKGPYLRISRPLQGVGNQFHYLHDALMISYEFEGTVIIPRLASYRIPMSAKDAGHRWKETAIENLFDIVTLVRRLRRLNIKVCVESKHFNEASPIPWCLRPFHFSSLSRRCFGKTGCFGRHATNVALRRYKPQTCLMLPNVWGAIMIPHETNFMIPALQLSLTLTLTIAFSSNLNQIGRRTFSEVQQRAGMSGANDVNVVHLRIERDYFPHMQIVYGRKNVSSIAALLEPYQRFFSHTKFSGFYYLAFGSIPKDDLVFVSTWANRTFGSSWCMKDDLAITDELSRLEPEQLAVVDYNLMVSAHRFIGTGLSSMSYIASEAREHRGLATWLVAPHASIYYPMMATRKRTWSEHAYMDMVI